MPRTRWRWRSVTRITAQPHALGGRGADGVIARLTGRVEAIEADRCVIDVGGVGYLVHASTRTLAAVPSGTAASLLIEMQVREDAIVLFGFFESAEREWFRLLTTVQGVGAKVALNILSALSPRELIAAIQAGDRASLTRAAVGRVVARLGDAASLTAPAPSGPRG
jgi:Holliday junction DNA helicase RuvA